MKEKLIEFLAHHSIDIFWAAVFAFVFAFVAGIIVELAFKPFRRLWKKRKALKEYYTFTGKSSSLKQKEERDKVLGGRPFNEYYYKREEDALIDKCLENKENVLVIGPPLMGKSRAVYQALIKLNKPQRVAIPKHININPETLQLPRNTGIIFIDDLQRFVEQQNFEHLFTTARENNIVIVAACRSGEKYRTTTSTLLAKNMPLETIFKDENIIELPRISKEAGKEIASKVEILWDKVKFRFDGNPGSIFMDLEEMGNRFDGCDDEKKTVLRAIRSLYLCGIYEENLLFPLQWIKITAKKVGLEKADYEWTTLLESLRDKEFISLEGDKIRIKDEVYLERIVTPLIEGEILDVSEDAVTTFSGVSKALSRLGYRAHTIVVSGEARPEYMDVAIKAYTSALTSWKPEDFPKEWAYNNRGNAYAQGKGSYDLAIADFNMALEINPGDALAYNNRGAVYFNKGDYDLAIADCNMALKINQRYDKAYNNRGEAYRLKGEYDHAIADYNKALEIDPMSPYPYNNRGLAYAQDNREYDRAISDYNRALEINPGDAKAYNTRAVAYYIKKAYDKALEDVYKAQELGYQVNPGFLDALRKASGRQR